MLGFSFKAGTDDLRESPVIEVIERLIGKGYDLTIYDRNVNIASLVGANRDFILNHIPHISKLMVKSRCDVLEHGKTIVIGNSDPEFKAITARIRGDQQVVDFVRAIEGRSPMASMTASAGELIRQNSSAEARSIVRRSIDGLVDWLEEK